MSPSCASPACLSTGFHAHTHLQPSGREIAIELFCFLAMPESLLMELASLGVHKRNLLEARVVTQSRAFLRMNPVDREDLIRRCYSKNRSTE
jgi:hypothetical protein